MENFTFCVVLYKIVDNDYHYSNEVENERENTNKERKKFSKTQIT